MATGVGHPIASSLQLMELHCEVNKRLPQTDKFEPLFWSLPQFMKLRQFQRNLLPQSPRIGKAVLFGAIGFVIFFSGVALLLGPTGIHMGN